MAFQAHINISETNFHSYNKTLYAKTDDLKMESNDWPIGPPGYGFPPELASLDSVLVKATGDGSTHPLYLQST